MAIAHLHDHHVAIKRPLSVGFSRTGDVGANLGDNGRAKGHVRDEVAVHDVDMQPIGTLVHLGRAFMAEAGEVGAEDGGGDNCGGRHGGGIFTRREEEMKGRMEMERR